MYFEESRELLKSASGLVLQGLSRRFAEAYTNTLLVNPANFPRKESPQEQVLIIW
jgi:hypothetical protein